MTCNDQQTRQNPVQTRQRYPAVSHVSRRICPVSQRDTYSWCSSQQNPYAAVHQCRTVEFREKDECSRLSWELSHAHSVEFRQKDLIQSQPGQSELQHFLRNTGTCSLQLFRKKPYPWAGKMVMVMVMKLVKWSWSHLVTFPFSQHSVTDFSQTSHCTALLIILFSQHSVTDFAYVCTLYRYKRSEKYDRKEIVHR